MTRGSRQPMTGGAIINPEYADFDPFATSQVPNPELRLFRIRDPLSKYFPEEVQRLFHRQELFCSSLSGQNDLFEGEPDFDEFNEPLADDQVKKLRIAAFSMLRATKEYGERSAHIAPNLGPDQWVHIEAAARFIADHFEHGSSLQELYQADQGAISKAIQAIKKNIRIGCFSGCVPSQAMWGYYKEHTGVCYEIDDSYMYRSRSPYLPHPVTYSEQSPSISLHDLSLLSVLLKLLEDWTLSDLSFMALGRPFLEALNNYGFHKTLDWAHEREVRILSFSSEAYCHHPGLKLRRIIIGANCDLQVVRSILKEKEVSVPVAKIVKASNKSFKVVDLE